MGNKLKLLLSAALAAVLASAAFNPAEAKKKTETGVPVCHIMVCCRTSTAGSKFLVNGEWIGNHNYADLEQCRDIMQKIKDAGINVVLVDFTNPSQWNGSVEPYYGGKYAEKLDNIVRVCQEKDMQFAMFLGNPARWTFKYWNEIAGIVLDRWADLPQYRKYGFGDKRPLLIMFYPGGDFKELWDRTPAEEKNNLEKFRIGTTQVNDPILPAPTDGWGYRNYSSSDDGKVRFACPNSGVPKADWKRIDAKEWQKRMDWVMRASEYCVIGSYDDTCDSIFWGIADCSGSTKGDVQRHESTASDPYVYYNIVKETIARYNNPSKTGSKK